MFVRFRQKPRRLQVALNETRRVDGEVRNEHVAGLGSLATPPSVVDRLEFWKRLYERLARLANRVDSAAHGKILAQIHERVPMVTADEQRALQAENAKRDLELWTSLRDMQTATAEDNKELGRRVTATIGAAETAAAQAAAKAETARERVERIARGENVEGRLGRPIDIDAVFLEAGWTRKDMRRAEVLASLTETEREELLQSLHRELRNTDRRATSTIARKILRRRAAGG
jgi:hypothetical protein